MKVAPKIVLTSLLASIVFGFVAQYVLFSHTVGLNLTALILVGIILVAWLYRRTIIDPDRSLKYLFAPLIIVAYGFGFPDSRNLALLNGIVGLLCLGYYALRTCSRKPLNLVQSILIAPFVTTILPFAGFLVPSVADWQQLKGSKRFTNGRGVLLGVFFAIPVLTLFGVVLSNADPLFAELFQFKFSFDPETLTIKTIIFGSAALTLAGLTAYLSRPMFNQIQTILSNQSSFNPVPPPGVHQNGIDLADEKVSDRNDHAVTFMTFFGLIAILFTLFMLVQVEYLVGGASVVLRTRGLAYAEYSKRGFLEIATVETICLPLIILGQYALKDLTKSSQRKVNLVASVVVGLLFLLMASAAFRLKLFVDNYGFTPLRFYVAVGMIWLVVLLVAYLRFGLRWQLDKMGKFAYASMVWVTLGVNVVRPDYWIARINLTRKVSMGIDTDMITGAGADAYSAIIQFGGKNRIVKGKERNLLAEFLDNQRRRSHDWRDMTLSQYSLPTH